MGDLKVVKLKKKTDDRSKSVREALKRTLAEADRYEEIIIMAKPKGDDIEYHWDYTDLKSLFWWVGFLNYLAHIFKVMQESEDFESGL